MQPPNQPATAAKPERDTEDLLPGHDVHGVPFNRQRLCADRKSISLARLSPLCLQNSINSIESISSFPGKLVHFTTDPEQQQPSIYTPHSPHRNTGHVQGDACHPAVSKNINATLDILSRAQGHELGMEDLKSLLKITTAHLLLFLVSADEVLSAQVKSLMNSMTVQLPSRVITPLATPPLTDFSLHSHSINEMDWEFDDGDNNKDDRTPPQVNREAIVSIEKGLHHTFAEAMHPDLHSHPQPQAGNVQNNCTKHMERGTEQAQMSDQDTLPPLSTLPFKLLTGNPTRSARDAVRITRKNLRSFGCVDLEVDSEDEDTCTNLHSIESPPPQGQRQRAVPALASVGVVVKPSGAYLQPVEDMKAQARTDASRTTMAHTRELANASDGFYGCMDPDGTFELYEPDSEEASTHDRPQNWFGRRLGR